MTELERRALLGDAQAHFFRATVKCVRIYDQ